jgi:hypothetical protein
MAITNNGTVNGLQTAWLPSGYTRPTVTKVTDYQYTYPLTLNVLKATVENATKATTMANIIANATIGITKQITDILAADYLASATVTAHAEWTGIKSNIESDATTDLLNATAVSYVCTVILYVKAA